MPTNGSAMTRWSPLIDRLEYILERYGDNNPVKEELIRQNFNLTLDFEKYLFRFLDFLPEEITRYYFSCSLFRISLKLKYIKRIFCVFKTFVS